MYVCIYPHETRQNAGIQKRASASFLFFIPPFHSLSLIVSVDCFNSERDAISNTSGKKMNEEMEYVIRSCLPVGESVARQVFLKSTTAIDFVTDESAKDGCKTLAAYSIRSLVPVNRYNEVDAPGYVWKRKLFGACSL